ncbi:conserved hypothetical protein [Perkinsus marinus ATCC 50983]|uniref:Serine aminopeptidase S33 domain-containing protein n=1 Tax=Perkinsus marinus (strain ATCC 50983 / TXsc) TaxID=423536 RepID=C5LZA1_PERM5|nr:conserved hypothetical protein [Perkinsus marinus ATCC 50983]EEQ97895.1 conserved hypothetical protein [Perkinsus marinus ATCC 50983]|eukprot:XP_002765178.1 conserved hypothetical protein [Perkinsus marinus ATCC 50983]
MILLSEYNALWKAIIRPSRDTYNDSDLGPAKFRISGVPVYREDIDLINSRMQRLKCSWFHPDWHFESVEGNRTASPCVVYLHGNCSSRVEGLQAIPVLLPLHISLFVFDFAGSGQSDGDYVSLGYYEKEDLATVLEYLRGSELVSRIGLWGRSMGAVTALLHGDRDPSIAGMVIDSAFADIRTLASDLAEELGLRLPGIMLSVVLGMLRLSVRSKAHFDIFDLQPIAHVDRTYIPALFTAARNDTFVNPRNTDALFEKYAGDKNMVKVDGNHNSTRPKFLMHSIAIFFINTLGCEATVDAILDLESLSPCGEERVNDGDEESTRNEVRDLIPVPAPPPRRDHIKFGNDRLIDAGRGWVVGSDMKV